MTTEVDNYLEHFGVKGMKWGKRRSASSSSSSSDAPKKTRKELRVLNKAEKVKTAKEHDAKVMNARDNFNKDAQSYVDAKKKYDSDRKVIGKEAAEKALIDAHGKYVDSFNTATMATTKEKHKQMILSAGLVTMAVVLAGINGAVASG